MYSSISFCIVQIYYLKKCSCLITSHLINENFHSMYLTLCILLKFVRKIIKYPLILIPYIVAQVNLWSYIEISYISIYIYIYIYVYIYISGAYRTSQSGLSL